MLEGSQRPVGAWDQWWSLGHNSPTQPGPVTTADPEPPQASGQK